jgi:predicted amidohydrolase
MVASNRVGTDEGVTTCGSSTVIDPYGVILAAASTDREELVQAEISVEAIRTVRSKMAVFAQRRADIYG